MHTQEINTIKGKTGKSLCPRHTRFMFDGHPVSPRTWVRLSKADQRIKRRWSAFLKSIQRAFPKTRHIYWGKYNNEILQWTGPPFMDVTTDQKA